MLCVKKLPSRPENLVTSSNWATRYLSFSFSFEKLLGKLLPFFEDLEKLFNLFRDRCRVLFHHALLLWPLRYPKLLKRNSTVIIVESLKIIKKELQDLSCDITCIYNAARLGLHRASISTAILPSGSTLSTSSCADGLLRHAEDNGALFALREALALPVS